MNIIMKQIAKELTASGYVNPHTSLDRLLNEVMYLRLKKDYRHITPVAVLILDQNGDIKRADTICNFCVDGTNIIELLRDDCKQEFCVFLANVFSGAHLNPIDVFFGNLRIHCDAVLDESQQHALALISTI